MTRAATLLRLVPAAVFVAAALWWLLSLYGNRPIFAKSDNGLPWARSHVPLASLIPAKRGAAMADSLMLLVHGHTGGLDSAFIADITVTNRSSAAVTDLVIACDALDESGATNGRAGTTLHEVFAPHSQQRVRNVSLGFVHRDVVSAHCAVADVTVR